MNLVMRLLLLILQKLWPRRRTPAHPLADSVLHFRCLPHDCDYNLHMTNSRYASFCDLGRIGAMFDAGVLVRLVRGGYSPIVTAQNTVYIREIRLGAKFSVVSRILAWDERFWYFQHDFIQDGSLKAQVFAKGFFVCRRKIVPFSEVLAFAAEVPASPRLSLSLQTWSRVNDELFQNALGKREDQSRSQDGTSSL